jgi:outer membrane protein TolC
MKTRVPLMSEPSITNKRHQPRSRALGAAIGAAAWLTATDAAALQPLGDFLAMARARSHDNREAVATTTQRREEADQAWGKLLPALTLGGAYTRNQYASEVSLPQGQGQPGRAVTITPINQWELSAQVGLPIVDVGSWKRLSSARATAEATEVRGQATRLEVERQVARSYYQLVGSDALVEASRRALEAAEGTRELARQRQDAGLASDLDLDRALAEVESRRQQLADAELGSLTARRSLETLSGLAPATTPATGLRLDDDLRAEAPLDSWGEGEQGPQVRAARLESQAASRSAQAAQAALYPTLSLSASERYTNAIGFGQTPSYLVGLTLSLRVDVSSIHGARAQEAAAEVARVREDRTRASTRDSIYTAWHQIRAQVAKSRSSRAQLAAATRAAGVARQRYAAGTATLLDVLVADRDAFSAEVARVQADADLAFARVQLRVSAGRSIAGREGEQP